MKKLCFLLFTGLLLASCSSEDSPLVEEPLTKMNALPGSCDYPLGNASDASASYTVETRTNPYSGRMEKIMTFRASLSRGADAHHGQTFRVFFFKDATLKEMVLTDSFITKNLTLEMDVTDYQQTKLYVLFKAVGCSSDMLNLHHGYKGEISFDPDAGSSSGTFRFSIVNGESLGVCTYPIGNATASYSTRIVDYPAGKMLTLRATLSGYDPHHSSGEWEVCFYADENLQTLIGRQYSDGRNPGETYSFEINQDVTQYTGYEIYVQMIPPHACSTGTGRKHYFLGKAEFNYSLDSDYQTFRIVAVNK